MNAKTYYQAIDEYQRLISQKQFNEYFLDRKRLDEVKGNLECINKNLIMNAKADLIIAEHKAKKYGDRQDFSSKLENLEKRLQQLYILRGKFLTEEPLDEKDYEDTYRKPKFIASLTVPQTCICLLAGTVLYLISKLFFY